MFRKFFNKSIKILSIIFLMTVVSSSYGQLGDGGGSPICCPQVITNTQNIVSNTSSLLTSAEKSAGILQNIYATLSNYLGAIKLAVTTPKPIGSYLDLMSNAINVMYQDIHAIYQAITSAPPESLNILAYYQAMNYAHETTLNQQNDLMDKINNLLQYGNFVTTNNLPEPKRGENPNINPNTDPNAIFVVNESSYTNNQAPPSAATLMSPVSYQYDKKQKTYQPTNNQELLDLLVNLSGGAYPIPRLKPLDINSSLDIQKYIAYQRTVSALQSIATYNFTQAYARRYPVNTGVSTTPSELGMLQAIAAGDSSSSTFWTNYNQQKTIFGKISMLLTSYFNKNYVLQDIDSQLEQIRIELAAMISLNVVSLQKNVGQMEYQNAYGIDAQMRAKK